MPVPKLTIANVWDRQDRIEETQATIIAMLDALSAPVVTPVPAPPVPAPPVPAPPVPVPAEDPIYAAAPTLIVPDVYVLAGSREATIRARLVMPDGSVPKRAFSMRALQRNGDGPKRLIYGDFWDLEGGDSPFLPSQGCVVERTIPLSGKVGEFFIDFGWSEDTPSVRPAVCTVHVVDELPAGYTPLPAPTAPPVYAAPKAAPIFATDFLDGFKVTANGGPDSFAAAGGDGVINNALGPFINPETVRTRSGKRLDPFPIIDGVRNLAMLDLGEDLVVTPSGNLYRYASPFFSTQNRFFPPFGVFELDHDPSEKQGSDAGWWMLRQAGGWPPELDCSEQWPPLPFARFAFTAHGAEQRIQGHRPFMLPDEHGRIVQRVRIAPDGVQVWINDRLVDETPNYFPGVEMYHCFSIEGPGGAGGVIDPSVDYGSIRVPLYGFKAWAL